MPGYVDILKRIKNLEEVFDYNDDKGLSNTLVTEELEKIRLNLSLLSGEERLLDLGYFSASSPEEIAVVDRRKEAGRVGSSLITTTDFAHLLLLVVRAGVVGDTEIQKYLLSLRLDPA